jgi:signal transduction histidine kinase
VRLNPAPEDFFISAPDFRVLSYLAGLEMAIDRLRRQERLLRLESGQTTLRIDALCSRGASPSTAVMDEIRTINGDFRELLNDLDDPQEEDTADRVVPIEFRPLVQRIFRLHQRLSGSPRVQLTLDLACEQIVWFPGRLRHVLENLISNAMKYSDPAKGEVRIQVGLRHCQRAYEIRVSDNGLGLSRDAQSRLFELFDRSGTSNLLNPVVGLAVLKLLIEQCGGTLSVESIEGQGAAFVAVLPQFELTDYLT